VLTQSSFLFLKAWTLEGKLIMLGGSLFSLLQESGHV